MRFNLCFSGDKNDKDGFIRQLLKGITKEVMNFPSGCVFFSKNAFGPQTEKGPNHWKKDVAL